MRAGSLRFLRAAELRFRAAHAPEAAIPGGEELEIGRLPVRVLAAEPRRRRGQDAEVGRVLERRGRRPAAEELVVVLLLVAGQVPGHAEIRDAQVGRGVRGPDRVGAEGRRVERVGRDGDRGRVGVGLLRGQRDGAAGQPGGAGRAPAEGGSVLGLAPEGRVELRGGVGGPRVRLPATGEGQEAGQEAVAGARGEDRETGRVGVPVVAPGLLRDSFFFFLIFLPFLLNINPPFS